MVQRLWNRADEEGEGGDDADVVEKHREGEEVVGVVEEVGQLGEGQDEEKAGEGVGGGGGGGEAEEQGAELRRAERDPLQ